MSNIKYPLYGVLISITLENIKHRRKIYRKFWYIINKESIKKQQKEYLQLNKNKVYISRLQYYLKNRKIILENAKKRYQTKKMQNL